MGYCRSAETRVNGYGELTTNEGHTLYYSGREKHQESVGFIVRKELINAVGKLYYHSRI